MKAIVYISGRIGKDTTLVDVIRQFKSFDSPDSLDAVIHSQGGNVEQGESIYNYLKGIDAEIPVTTITDKAYSIAAKVFAAGRERIVEDVDNAIMIHFPWAKVEGNAERLEEVAGALREMEDSFASFYSEFLAIDETTIRSLLDNETFISGSDAVDFGLATKTKVTAEAVAELNIHESKNFEMTEKKKDKSFFKKLLADISAYLKEDGVEINAEMTLQDSNGTDIVFPDLAAGDVPKVGDAATIDGAPIPDGSYIMPSVDESTLVFVSGKVTEVIAKEAEVEVPAEIVAEEVQQISVWTMEVVNTSFAVGDVVKYKDWDGNEVTIGSGEFQLSDGRRVVTDATGVIVMIKEAVAGKSPEEVDISAEVTFDKMLDKVKTKVKAELKAEYEASIVQKDNEIKALKKKFGSKEFNAEERAQESAPEVKPSQASVLLTRTKKQ